MSWKKYAYGFAAIAAAFAVSAPAAHAQTDNWPSRQVTIVVPYGPGASNDLFARSIADYLTKKFNVPFIVDNRPGAGGFVGSSLVSKAAPDGYTLLEHNNVISGIGPGQKLDFDPDRDLTALSMIGRSPNAVLVSKVHGIDSVQKLIDYSKAHPEDTFFAVAGIGNSLHLQMERFMNVTGAKLKPVVYPSSAQMLTDLVAGRIHTLVNTVSAAQGQIAAGQLGLLAYTDVGATPDAPKAKTLKELGVDFSYSVWWGIWGPPKMPKPLADKINAALNEAINSPAFVTLLANSGATVELQTPEQFRATVKEETDVVTKMTAESKIGK